MCALTVQSVRAYVGLGSNLGDPPRQIRSALDALEGIPHTHLVAHSSLYLTPPMGPRDQPDYVNAVAAVDCGLGPHALLEALQAIESRHGRVRGLERWGPRTLDLDLLLFGILRHSDEWLTLPHPGITQRAFVLCPLHEIAPELVVPGAGRVSDLVVRVSGQGLRRLESAP